MSTLDEFYSAYDRVLQTWPVEVETIDLKTVHGSTRINACGPVGGPPLILLPGAGATSTVWFANVAALATRYRVYAVDLMGDVGRSVPGEQEWSLRNDPGEQEWSLRNDPGEQERSLRNDPGKRSIDSVEELLNWVTAVLDGLNLPTAALCGHSYGAMIALAYTLRHPDRIDALTLLDSNSCFGSMSPRYLLHAIPILVSANEKRQRRFVDWETGGLELDPDWLDVLALGAAHFPKSKTIVPKRPKPAAFENFGVDTTVVLAGQGKVHNAVRIEAAVRAVLPRARTVVLANATHHGLPMHPAAEVSEILLS